MKRLTTEQRLNARLTQFTDSMRAIAHDPDACTCDARSWHGKGHDSACPITIARHALRRKVYPGGADVYRLNDREHATVLAALRYWQAQREEVVAENDIATNGGTVLALTDHEIDALCERLNCGG